MGRGMMALARISRLVVLAAAVLAIGACGNDDSGAPSPDPVRPGADETAGIDPASGQDGERVFCEAVLGLDRLRFELGDEPSPDAVERFRGEFSVLFVSYASNAPPPVGAEVETIVTATIRAFLGNRDLLESPEYSQAQAAVSVFVSETC
jgi:hypothetical protein